MRAGSLGHLENAPLGTCGYSLSMATSESAHWLVEAALPLAAHFGDGVAVLRDGNAVRYAFGTQSAIVELEADGRLSAAFAERALDAVSGKPAIWLYRRGDARYGLSREGSERMTRDMVAFFSGVREPQFRFVDVLAPPN